MKISVIVPCYNEEEVLFESAVRLKKVINGCLTQQQITDYEIIFVDDGSNDGTPEILKSLSSEDPKIKVVTFSRNFGHQVAITAGINFSQSNAVVIIDADLQDPPELIPEMVSKWKQGYKVVHMKRKRRQGESVLKLALANMFYRIFNVLSIVKIPLDVGDFKLLDKDVVNYLKELREHTKFIRGQVMLAGYSQTYLEYERQPRFAGGSKYSLLKSSGLALNGVVSLSPKPLRIVTFLGIFGVIASILVGIYTLLSKFLLPDKVIPGWASLLLITTFFSSIQLISMGIVGEYVGRIFDEVKNRPIYVIKEKINC